MKKLIISGQIILIGLFFAGAVVANDQIPVEAFLKLEQFNDMKISPTGEYLAVTVPQENRTSLFILRRSTMEVTGKVILEPKAHVAGFDWVNPTRVFFTTRKKLGRLSIPSNIRGLFAVNADGSDAGRIGYFDPPMGLLKGYMALSLMDSLENDDQHALVFVDNYGEGEYQVNTMNVYTGKMTKVPTRSPNGKYADFYSDNIGQVRFATTYSEGLDSKTYYRAADRADWEVINDQSYSKLHLFPVGYASDNSAIYLQSQQDSGPDAIYSFSTTTKEKKILLKDATVNPGQLLESPVDKSLYAVRYFDGYPKYEYLDKESPYAKVLKGLHASFPGSSVVPTSFTKDGRLGLFYVRSDTNAGEYYSYDFNTKEASFIAASAPQIDPQKMATMKPIIITARDGLKVHGFLTIPKGSDGKNLPLVINPHGGPFGEADYWGYNPETQLLANRGYAVMQLNFRGSGNYGRDFEVAGYRQWGGAMQDDLTDATKWAVAQGIANPKRICIYGASYGAYAALAAAVKEPQLYACAVGNVGVYDLVKTNSDTSSRSTELKNYMERTMGSTGLAANSPNLQAGKITIPVLMMAGDEDETAPMEHSKRMNEALKRLNKPVELVIYKKEGHGNYLMTNRIDFANRLLAFLDTHIGPNSQKAKAN